VAGGGVSRGDCGFVVFIITNTAAIAIAGRKAASTKRTSLQQRLPFGSAPIVAAQADGRMVWAGSVGRHAAAVSIGLRSFAVGLAACNSHLVREFLLCCSSFWGGLGYYCMVYNTLWAASPSPRGRWRITVGKSEICLGQIKRLQGL
jgi:hypothetical protein